MQSTQRLMVQLNAKSSVRMPPQPPPKFCMCKFDQQQPFQWRLRRRDDRACDRARRKIQVHCTVHGRGEWGDTCDLHDADHQEKRGGVRFRRSLCYGRIGWLGWCRTIHRVTQLFFSDGNWFLFFRTMIDLIEWLFNNFWMFVDEEVNDLIRVFFFCYRRSLFES